MKNNKCNNIHKYGPFIKENNYFYRVCLKCNKKTTYPFSNEIENEYNNQLITNNIIDIITNKKINIIQDNNYFFKLTASLIDNISYIYLDQNHQEELLNSLQEFNTYYNKKNTQRYNITKELVKYLKEYLTNYNNEINNNYDENILNTLDNDYINLYKKISIELSSIISNEENTTITIDNEYSETNDEITLNINEAENEAE